MIDIKIPWTTSKTEDYGEPVDELFKGASISNFKRLDWLKLAFAALDQAGSRATMGRDRAAFEAIERLIRDAIPEECACPACVSLRAERRPMAAPTASGVRCLGSGV